MGLQDESVDGDNEVMVATIRSYAWGMGRTSGCNEEGGYGGCEGEGGSVYTISQYSAMTERIAPVWF